MTEAQFELLLAAILALTSNGPSLLRWYNAGCTEPEIAAITGHSLRDVRSILETHYLHRDPMLGENAISKLEKRTKAPN